jgi:phenylacetate-coenzyme A ligase PaaK-like adenylate-forming protein
VNRDQKKIKERKKSLDRKKIEKMTKGGNTTCKKEIGKLAREAYQRYPFYKWFYRKAGLSPEDLEKGIVPVVDKYDFFAYEDEKGAPYYQFEELNLDDPDIFLARTTGIAGRPLEIVLTRDTTVWTRCLQERFSDLLERDGELRILFSEETSKHLLNLFRTKKERTKALLLPRGTLNEKLAFLKKNKPHILFDSTNTAAQYFVDNNVNLADYGIQYVLYVKEAPLLRKALKRQGLQLVSAFIGLDTAIAGFGCPLNEERKHLYSPLCLYEVLTDKGVLLPSGRGLLVSTIPSEPFPLIRYTSRDNVELPESRCDCGYGGHDIYFLGRENSVIVPTESEVLVEYERVLDAFRDKPYAQNVLTTYMDVEENGTFKNILATFIGCDVDKPHLDEDMSVEVMWIGASDVLDTHLRYLPVIYVPKDTIPWEKWGLSGSFLDLTTEHTQENQEAAEHFASIVEQVTSWQVRR